MNLREYTKFVLDKVEIEEKEKNYEEIVRLLLVLQAELNHQIREYEKLKGK